MSPFNFMAVIFPSLKSLAPYLETSVSGEAWQGILDKKCTNFETALDFQGVRVGDRQERTRHGLQSPPLRSVSGQEGSGPCGANVIIAKSSTWRVGQGAGKLWELKSDYLRFTASSYHTPILLAKSENKVRLSSLAWLNKLLEPHTLGTRDQA